MEAAMAARLGFWLRDAAPLHGAGFWKKMRLEIFGFGQGPCSTFGPLCPHYGVFCFFFEDALIMELMNSF
jgi:hypothetical protein